MINLGVSALFGSRDEDIAGDNCTVYDSIVLDEEEDDIGTGLSTPKGLLSIASEDCCTDGTIVEIPYPLQSVSDYISIQCKPQW